MTEGAAAVANFTLEKVDFAAWSAKVDFGIDANLATTYVDGGLGATLAAIVAAADANLTTLTTLATTRAGNAVHLVQLNAVHRKWVIADVNKLRVALIGGMNGDEPIGAEVLVRFLRHLITGGSRSDVVAVLRAHTRTYADIRVRSPPILADLEPYAVCFSLPQIKTS